MSSAYSSQGQRPTFATVLRSFTDDPGLPFADLLTEKQIQQIADEEGVSFGQGPGDVWDAPLTVWAWLGQCLSAARSCVAAVARAVVLRAALRLSIPSANPGAYCKARAKLPEAFLRRLALQVGTALEDQAPPDWRWHGKRALLIDGTECTAADTPANQAEYPQPTSQKAGLGFPMIRLVVLLTFATAALVGCALGPHQGKQTGETALLRALLHLLRPGDLAVADRYQCSYWQVALLRAQGVDCCFRLHQRRKFDFRKGRRLGKDDHVVTWAKPARPGWLDEQTHAALPASLTVREVRFAVANPGYRSKEIIVATTLLDARAYPRGDIAELYHSRWNAELDIRCIKQTLGVDVLRCQTPAMVRKEIWMHLLAYNLARQALAQAARAGEVKPRGLSFAGAVQTLDAFRWVLLLGEPSQRAVLLKAVLVALGTHVVGSRPGRCEPRKVKRRPKPFPRLMKPRAQERAELLKGSEG